MPKIYCLKIKLRGVRPAVARLIELPAKSDFVDLHHAIQDALGWAGDGAFHFQENHPKPYLFLSQDPDWPGADWTRRKHLSADSILLREVLTALGERVYYIYHPDHNWQFTVELVDIYKCDDLDYFPCCIGGKGDAPAEADAFASIPFDTNSANDRMAARRQLVVFSENESTDEADSSDEIEGDDSPALLINLSNHPSTGWSESQREAAIAQFDEILDIAFPDVAPDADPREFLDLIADYYQQILRVQQTNPGRFVVVHIMGEQTFCFALIRLLQCSGIPCVASTSQRLVEELPNGGGKKVRFEFEQFRAYMDLSATNSVE